MATDDFTGQTAFDRVLESLLRVHKANAILAREVDKARQEAEAKRAELVYVRTELGDTKQKCEEVSRELIVIRRKVQDYQDNLLPVKRRRKRRSR